MEAFIIVWAVATIIATVIGSRKGRGGTGFLLGLPARFIGVIIIACMKPTQEEQIRRAQEQMNIQYAAQQRMLEPDRLSAGVAAAPATAGPLAAAG